METASGAMGQTGYEAISVRERQALAVRQARRWARKAASEGDRERALACLAAACCAPAELHAHRIVRLHEDTGQEPA